MFQGFFAVSFRRSKTKTYSTYETLKNPSGFRFVFTFFFVEAGDLLGSAIAEVAQQGVDAQSGEPKLVKLIVGGEIKIVGVFVGKIMFGVFLERDVGGSWGKVEGLGVSSVRYVRSYGSGIDSWKWLMSDHDTNPINMMMFDSKELKGR